MYQGPFEYYVTPLKHSSGVLHMLIVALSIAPTLT